MSTPTDDKIDRFIDRMKQFVNAETGPKFLGTPERWMDADPVLFRCPNDHVSTRYLRTEVEGNLCLAAGCRQPIHITFPEDIEGPLP